MMRPAAEPDNGRGPSTLASLLAGGVDHRTAPAESIAPRALRAIRQHLGLDVAFVSEFTGGQRVFRYVDADSPDPPVAVGDSGALEDSYCQRVADGRLPKLIRDARTVPAAAELPVTHSLPVGAHVSVPIRLSDGQLYGTFCCFGYEADESLTERDVAVMEVLADLVAEEIDARVSVERAQVEVRARVESVIEGEGLTMVYQPIFDLGRGQPVGYEALARFSPLPRRGPDEWFADAAQVGLGIQLELAAVAAALDAIDVLPSGSYLAVNVSPETILCGRLPTVFQDVEPTRLVVELTEHAAIPSYDGLDTALIELRERGVRLAVDDAGAGYATFRHILRLRPDIIKLDMTITRDVDHDPARRALATALVAFARDTGAALVAEGIETKDELRTLRSLGVRAAQGYYLGRPAEVPDRRRFIVLSDASTELAEQALQ